MSAVQGPHTPSETVGLPKIDKCVQPHEIVTSHFESGDASVDVEGLLQNLTLEEKLSLLAGSYFWGTSGVPRLNIPALKVTDGPNGARGSIVFDGVPAACFPASVSIASSFNTQLARRIGQAIGQEALTKGATILMGPTVCMHRSPLGGRNFESFSEDPVLAGLMATEYVTGIQSEDVAACIKHYVLNEQETRRNTVNEIIAERPLREIYLRPFEIVVRKAKPWSLMTSFPKVNNVHCDMSDYLLKQILREEWNWDGMIMSDWEGTNSTVKSLNAGLDLEMPGPTRKRTPALIRDALQNGTLAPSTIDDRARSVLNLLKKTRKFTDRRDLGPERAVDLPEHRSLIREAGGEGMVLLKNENCILPLKTEQLKSIALIGPLTKYSAAHGGGSAMLTPHYKITPWDALNSRIGKDLKLNYAQGANIDRVYPSLSKNVRDLGGNSGFTASYFADDNFSTIPVDQNLAKASFLSMMNSPIENPKSARLSTVFSPDVSGNHYLSYSTMGKSKLFINDKMVFEQKEPTSDVLAFVFGVQEEAWFQYYFTAGEEYRIKAETVGMISTKSSTADEHVHTLLDGVMGIHIGFQEQAHVEADLKSEAALVAAESDLAIIFVGNTTQWEAEGSDMGSMSLPMGGSQDALILAISEANPNTIVINTTGVAIDARAWIDKIQGFAQAWFAGQESGNAIADLLLGKINPSGKLPITWPRRIEDTASFGNFGMDSWESQLVEYAEGIYIGYRDADKFYGTEAEALFSFGFGLSYTNFDLHHVKICGTLGDETVPIHVEVEVCNVGDKGGAEVVQVYLQRTSPSSVDRPIKELVGFSKVFVEPRASQMISIEIDDHAGYFWDEKSAKWELESGDYQLLVGNSSRPVDLGIKLPVHVKGNSIYKTARDFHR